MCDEKEAASVAKVVMGLMIIIVVTFACDRLFTGFWNIYGRTIEHEGIQLLEIASAVLRWGMIIGPAAVLVALLARLLMPRFSEYIVARAEARLANKEASRDVIANFGGSEAIVRYDKNGGMTIYDPTGALVDRVRGMSGSVNDLPALLSGMGGIVQPTAANKINRIENNYHNDDAPQLPAPLPKLSNLLPKAQRILISGGQNAGKTTICQWLAYYKLQAGKVIVIDSHATPARWPDGCEVIGAGRDYDKIEALLKWMLAEMDRRFKEQAQGIVPERGHEIISVVSDEWTILPEVIKNVEQYTTPLLTETRKAGFDFYLASHDVTVEALGIRGKSGLRKAFDFAVLCDYDIRTDERHTYVNFMKAGRVSEKDNIEYDPPGPFMIQGQAQALNSHPLLAAVGDVWDFSHATENLADQQVIDEYLKTGSYSRAFRLLYKLENDADYEGAIGGNQTAKVKAILDKHHITHPVSQ